MKHSNPTRAVRPVDNPDRAYGNSIMKVARHFHAARSDSRILEVADELQEQPGITVLAIIDAGDRPLGYLTRDQLFSTLGKPYGRDILSRSLIAELATPTTSFNQHTNIFTVVEAVDASDADHFLLVDADGRHAGIFTRQDLMTFLSRMTQEDIAMAGRLQERMIGVSTRHQGQGWDFRAWCHPAKGVGGDFYLARELDGGKWFFTLCDVSGKGVAASILSSMVWGMLSMYDFRLGLKPLIHRINEAVITTFQLERYLTGVFMIWDPAAGRLQWADMGHSHLAVSRDGASRFLQGKRANLPIGLEPDIDPSVWVVRLQPGDRITAFTDGITEQENAAKEEFGETRLFHLLNGEGKGLDAAGTEPSRPGAVRSPNPLSLAERIPAIMEAWRGTIPQQDDMSFIMLECP